MSAIQKGTLTTKQTLLILVFEQYACLSNFGLIGLYTCPKCCLLGPIKQVLVMRRLLQQPSFAGVHRLEYHVERPFYVSKPVGAFVWHYPFCQFCLFGNTQLGTYRGATHPSHRENDQILAYFIIVLPNLDSFRR